MRRLQASLQQVHKNVSIRDITVCYRLEWSFNCFTT